MKFQSWHEMQKYWQLHGLSQSATAVGSKNSSECMSREAPYLFLFSVMAQKVQIHDM